MNWPLSFLIAAAIVSIVFLVFLGKANISGLIYSGVLAAILYTCTFTTWIVNLVKCS